MTSARRWLLLVASAGIVIAVDQLTKWWAVRQLAPVPMGEGRTIDVVGTLRFTYAENTGMAFSRGADSGRWIGLVVVVVVIMMVYFAARVRSRTVVVLLGIVIGGALGNLLDRAFRANNGWLSGAVVDFVDLQWWPVFNVADSAVVVGGIALVFVATREPTEPKQDPEPSDGSALTEQNGGE